jgi:hypothetical protein
VEANGVLGQNSAVSVTGNCYSVLGVTPLVARCLLLRTQIPPVAQLHRWLNGRAKMCMFASVNLSDLPCSSAPSAREM